MQWKKLENPVKTNNILGTLKMKKLSFFTGLVIIVSITINCMGIRSSDNNKNQFNTLDSLLLKETYALANEITIIDCHSHSLFQSKNKNEKQVSFPAINAGSVNGIVQSFPVNRNNEGSISEQILADIQSVREEIRNKLPQVSIALQSTDFMNKPDNQNTTILFAVESFKGLSEGNISLLKKYHDEGVRVIGINNSGDDNIYNDNLLTNYGINYVEELNRLGMICDITHIRRSIQSQIIDLSTAPVIISHGGAFGAVGSEFNTPDSILIKMVQKGGMIGITLFSGQISNKVLSELESGVKWNKTSRATIEDLIDHIDYLREKIGIDYIGIGSDYGGSGKVSPTDLETISGYPMIIYQLLKHGYSKTDIKKIMGQNFLQFWKRVEEASNNNK